MTEYTSSSRFSLTELDELEVIAGCQSSIPYDTREEEYAGAVLRYRESFEAIHIRGEELVLRCGRSAGVSTNEAIFR